MSRLQNLLDKYCPNGCEYRQLKTLEEDNTITLGRGNVISKSYIAEHKGDYPVFSSAQTNNGVIGCCNTYMFDDVRITWSIDGGGKFFYRDDAKYSVTNVCGWCKVNNETILNPRYLYFALINEWKKKIYDYTHKAHPSVIREEYEIPVPPLPVQEEIVRILDKFTELEAELEAELEMRKKQYEYYRDKLLSLEDYDGEVKIVPLRDVLKEQIHTGLNPRKFFQVNTDDATNYYVTIREMVDGRIEFNDRTDRLNDEAMQLCQNRSKLEDGCLLFSGTGTIGVVVLVEKKPDNWNIKEGVYVIKPNQDIILSTFMKYALQSRQFIKAYTPKIVGGTVKSIPMKELMDIEIMYPIDLKYQQILVDKLDRFNILVHDISEGLPAEIKMRHQQYEYYRDKLLSFKRLERETV